MKRAKANDEFDGGIIELGETFFDRALVVANDDKEAAIIASAFLVRSFEKDGGEGVVIQGRSHPAPIDQLYEDDDEGHA